MADRPEGDRHALSARARPIFFVHVMKTGGTAFVDQALTMLRPDESWGPTLTREWPDGDELTAGMRRYTSVDEMAAADLAGRRLVAAHVPWCATRLAPPGAVTFSLVRDPVERTLSYLDQMVRTFPDHQRRPPQWAYEDVWYRTRFLGDHQTKVFAMTWDEATAPLPVGAWDGPADRPAGPGRAYLTAIAPTVGRLVPLDRARLADAKAALEQVEVLGVQDDQHEAVERLVSVAGWPWPGHVVANHGIRPSMPETFRRRIADDCVLDLELVEHARQVVAAQRRAARRSTRHPR